MVSQSDTTTFILFVTSLLLINPSVSGNPTTKEVYFILQSCNRTEHPDVCFTSLASYASAVRERPGKLAKASIAVSISKARYTSAYLTYLSASANYSIVNECISYVEDTIDDLQFSLTQLRGMLVQDAAGQRSGQGFRGLLDDVRTYLSSSHTNEVTCIDEVEESGIKEVFKKKVSDSVNELKRINAVALDLFTLYINNGAPPPDSM